MCFYTKFVKFCEKKCCEMSVIESKSPRSINLSPILELDIRYLYLTFILSIENIYYI